MPLGREEEIIKTKEQSDQICVVERQIVECVVYFCTANAAYCFIYFSFYFRCFDPSLLFSSINLRRKPPKLPASLGESSHWYLCFLNL
jgi:hypothetical protein